ncbi:GOLPH3/VPS74 family protein [Actinocatenispora rupis]|uniref:Golgi phosphoprotein 3 (GPP34) n=1 Tax=Actinocatenispora rupis TaxID=519421 RepID=A0A8J3NFU0_9ACTN|nr:GPP34 family phosphoprotein [Actinocatenispora rupis]GID15245.1 hypothetical protein Aru02nite_61340 [Actinocatenispora rupis]
MRLPDDLPSRMYLLALDPAKERLVARDRIGYLLRGAALADLLLAGALRDEQRKAVPTGLVADSDPFAADVLAEIAASGRPRDWRHWVRRQARQARPRVRDRLVDNGFLTVETRRVLGIFPSERLTVTDPRTYRAYVDGVGQALRGDRPVDRVEARDAAAVALAAAAELRTVLSGSERRSYKKRIEMLAESVDPVATAVRKAIQSDRAAAASAGAAAGS